MVPERGEENGGSLEEERREGGVVCVNVCAMAVRICVYILINMCVRM